MRQVKTTYNSNCSAPSQVPVFFSREIRPFEGALGPDLGGFFIFFSSMYCIQHCFICRPSDFTVSVDAGIKAMTVATSALAVRRSNQLARSHQHTRSHQLLRM